MLFSRYLQVVRGYRVVLDTPKIGNNFWSILDKQCQHRTFVNIGAGQSVVYGITAIGIKKTIVKKWSRGGACAIYGQTFTAPGIILKQVIA